MSQFMYRVLAWITALVVSGGVVQTEAPVGPEISAPSAVLMEASTGQIIYEKNGEEQRSPASITKIMTLILIFDAIDSGKISLSDQVVTSAYAKSMGGSQVFLEEGEMQTVETLIKCIVIASGNDASVAMAEYIAGSEEEFVRQMNERAKGLGMNDTNFEDCCGLTDSPTHVTKQGTREFGLSNTNRLLKMATNFRVTGLKTGSTSTAKYCLSATAEKDGIELIAAVMAAPDYKARFADAAALLNYGYSICRLYEDPDPPVLPSMPVEGGVEEQTGLVYDGAFSYLSTDGEDFGTIERILKLEETLKAPVEAGQKAGILEYRLQGEKIGEIPVVTETAVRQADYPDYLKRLVLAWLTGL